MRPGPPLGVTRQATYSSTPVCIGFGDTLAFYTDGVIERRQHSLDDGMTQLRTVFDATNLEQSLDDACTRLIDGCFPSIPTHDDQCVLIIQADLGLA